MHYLNENILTEDLPTIEKVDFKPLEKDYLKVSRISFAISTCIILAIGFTAFYFIKKLHAPFITYSAMVVFVSLTIYGWIANNMNFRYSGYALREKDILFRRGWLIRKTRIVPLKRIQHVSVQSGPIERKFGLASISIFTAGSGEADFTIRGITEKTAQQIKEWISIQLDGEFN